MPIATSGDSQAIGKALERAQGSWSMSARPEVNDERLIRYEAARNALTEAVEFDEVMSIMDVAEQAALYAKQAGDNELIEKATEIRVRAQRKAGEMLTKAAELGMRATQGTGNPEYQVSKPATLAQIGITRDQSSRYQQLAAMPADHFETAVATAKATAGEVTTAFMLREASKAKPAPMKSKVAEKRRQELREAQERGVSMLCTYARLTILALDSLKQFTEEELQVLEDLQTAMDRAPQAPAAKELSTGLDSVAVDSSSHTHHAPAARNQFTKHQRKPRPNLEVERAVAMLDGVCFILKSIDPSQLDSDRSQQWASAMKKHAAPIAQFATRIDAGLGHIGKAG